MGKLRAVYYINQFYAGIGGEEMADVGLSVYDEKKGPAMGIEPMWKGEMEVVKVLVCGDNYINTDARFEEILPRIKEEILSAKPDVFVCKKCGAAISKAETVANKYVCRECGYYFRIRTKNRIKMCADAGTFEPWFEDVEQTNPLDFPGYDEKLAQTQEKTGLAEGVTSGYARIDGEPVVLGVCDARFLMGSMGHVVGEKIASAVERATEEKLPVILFCCSGGARMQEGIISLMQMAKVAEALGRHDEAGLLYITVLTDPTTGGVTASFAMLGDIILSEPKALIGFAGQRVIQGTIHQKLPEGFQRAEFQLEHGFVDRIVHREKLRGELGKILLLHKEE